MKLEKSGNIFYNTERGWQNLNLWYSKYILAAGNADSKDANLESGFVKQTLLYKLNRGVTVDW